MKTQAEGKALSATHLKFFRNESTTANKAFTNSVDFFKTKAQSANKTYPKHLGR